MPGTGAGCAAAGECNAQGALFTLLCVVPNPFFAVLWNGDGELLLAPLQCCVLPALQEEAERARAQAAEAQRRKQEEAARAQAAEAARRKQQVWFLVDFRVLG